MTKKLYQVLNECVFIPKTNLHFSPDMDAKLMQIVTFNSDDLGKMKFRYLVGHFRGLVDRHDVLGVTQGIDDLTLSFECFKIIHKELGIDISNLTLDEFTKFKRSHKIDKLFPTIDV